MGIPPLPLGEGWGEGALSAETLSLVGHPHPARCARPLPEGEAIGFSYLTGKTGLLILRPGALGDTLLSVPALRALRRAYSPLRLAAHSATARLLASLGEVDEGLSFDDPSLGWLFGDRTPRDSEPLIAWINPAAAPALRNALLVAPSRPPEEDQHCAHYLLESLAPLGIELGWDDSPLNVAALRSEGARAPD